MSGPIFLKTPLACTQGISFIHLSYPSLHRLNTNLVAHQVVNRAMSTMSNKRFQSTISALNPAEEAPATSTRNLSLKAPQQTGQFKEKIYSYEKSEFQIPLKVFYGTILAVIGIVIGTVSSVGFFLFVRTETLGNQINGVRQDISTLNGRLNIVDSKLDAIKEANKEFKISMNEFKKETKEAQKETNAKLDFMQKETNARLDFMQKETNVRLDFMQKETNAKLDFMLEASKKNSRGWFW